jgi:hypothetical protein
MCTQCLGLYCTNRLEGSVADFHSQAISGMITLDIDQQHSFSVNDHLLHLARLEVSYLADGDVLGHMAPSFSYFFSLSALPIEG